MNVGIIADLHMENNRNLLHGMETAKWIGNKCINNNVKHLIVAGDFGNNRQYINVLALNRMTEILEYWNQIGLQPLILVGNHEQYYKNANIDANMNCECITSLKPFNKHAMIFDKYSTYTIENTIFHFVPFCENKCEFQKFMQTIKTNLTSKTKNVLIGHQDIYGAIMNDLSGTKDTTGVKSEEFNYFDYAFFGHYHSRQQINEKSLMVGSPYMLNFGEDFNDKGLTIYDTTLNTIKFIENPAAQLYITFTLDMEYKNRVQGRFVRFLLKDVMTPDEQEILKQEVMNLGALSISLLPVYDKISQNIDIDVSSNNLNMIINEYIEKNKNDLQKDQLMKLYDKTINEVV